MGIWRNELPENVVADDDPRWWPSEARSMQSVKGRNQMELSIRLGKGRDAELDAARERVSEAARVLEQRKEELAALAEDQRMLELLGLKIGDVLVETRNEYRRPDKTLRWQVVGTRVNKYFTRVDVVAKSVRKDGSLGEREMSEYADVKLEEK